LAVRKLAEWSRATAPAVVIRIAGGAAIIHTLTGRRVRAISVGLAPQTKQSVRALTADGGVTATAFVGTDLTKLACTGDTLTKVWIGAMVIIDALGAIGPSETQLAERRALAATRVIVGVTAYTFPVYTLARGRVITVVIATTRGTGSTIVNAERCLLSTTAIICWVTDLANRVDALLSITISVGSTPDARAAVGGTEGRITTTSGAVRWVAGNAGLVDALAGVRVITIEVGAATNTA